MAALSQRPRRKTASRCSPETEQCTHTLEIAGYSMYKDLAAGKSIQSATFAVGGHDWCLLYYPNGNATIEDSKDHVAVHVKLVSKATEDVTVLLELRLFDQTTGVSIAVARGVKVFKSTVHRWGSTKFKKKSELETMPYLKDDRVVVECDLTVVRTPLSASATVWEIQVPPSDLSHDLGKLLEAEEDTDVAFKVEEEVFRAHKIVLAMRSPVFKAELLGPMSGDTSKGVITVDDMQPVVFRALLGFIYTDSLLPAMDDLDGDDGDEMLKHLLVAADRYAMERMKLLCESVLCKRLDIESVGDTLALADQHHCAKLKDACIEFINSLDTKSDVEGFVASQGYGHLKRECPALFLDIWEKAAKSRKF